MLEPAYTFTIPSLHNDTPLDCRIHEPMTIQDLLNRAGEGGQVLRGAIIAHPYASLGGSYDDPVVLALTRCLLHSGFIVGTFNFRGASESKGRTSWTGRAERQDYASFAGFMIYLLQRLQSPAGARRPILQGPQGSDLSRATIDTIGSSTEHPIARPSLLLAGYSYGSLILSRLPSVATLISRFEEAQHGTTATEIVLCARKLAQDIGRSAHAQQTPASPRGRQLMPPDHATSPTSQRMRPSPVVMGGEETDPAERRRSRDSRRSLDVIRRSVDLPQRVKAHLRRKSGGVTATGPNDEPPMPLPLSPLLTAQQNATNEPEVDVSYLLVSPVLPPLAHTLVAPGSVSTLFSSPKSSLDRSSGFGALESPTLLIWGSADSFTSSRRLRSWADKLKTQSTEVEWAQVERAGHFWRKEGVMTEMLEKVTAWVEQKPPISSAQT
ncbi:hypothetical protein B0A48_06520 [Cryoendolithus antarcticus]|uniref:AB hydrolase-1 domain-containing protein n=1 Tax=Cryoendolithus antarcticus TaxID=1507870 RepID=A0A1V8TBA9_9PEZI|nr:hypothetical protein B0A48_06520 [Cryoendolithus antarcticus]